MEQLGKESQATGIREERAGDCRWMLTMAGCPKGLLLFHARVGLRMNTEGEWCVKASRVAQDS